MIQMILEILKTLDDALFQPDLMLTYVHKFEVVHDQYLKIDLDNRTILYVTLRCLRFFDKHCFEQQTKRVREKSKHQVKIVTYSTKNLFHSTGNSPLD